MTLTPHITSMSFCVPLTREQWDSLMSYEKAYDNRKTKIPQYDAIDKSLERHGADNIEYNGHFGMNIFFSAKNPKAAARVCRRLAVLLSKPKKF